MLRINALKIHVVTEKGIYGSPVIPFDNGLNIVKGHNSRGKSTVFQSILYCLGMEELLGGKNEKTMQSVLKSEILNDDNIIEAHVLESSIVVELAGKIDVSVRRYVKSETKSTGLLEVHKGHILTGQGDPLSQPMYVHDPGSATKGNPFSFHNFLEGNMEWKLPYVQYKDGASRKLYLQNIFPAFVVEQKAGWTDFLSTIPYYSLVDKETRAIEFLLNLDSWKIQQKKSQLKQDKNELTNEWKDLYFEFKSMSNQIGCQIQGVQQSPSIVESEESVFLSYQTEESRVSLKEYVERLERDFQALIDIEVNTIEESAKENEMKIALLTDRLSRLSVQLSNLINNKNLAFDKYKSFQRKLAELENDKVQNEYHLKVKNKGAEAGFEIAHDNCPYCSQELNDSLLPKDIEVVPMGIEDNIEYLKSQINLLKIYMVNHESDIQEYESEIDRLNEVIGDVRSEIRILKTELTSDNRLPSIEVLEKRINLKNKLTLYRRKLNESLSYQSRFKGLSDRWVEILGAESQLPKKLSIQDFRKINHLQTTFRQLLQDFHYSSKPLDSISISVDTLMPVVDQYSLKFDSSASDFIRTIWSYTLALRETSEVFKGNHPNLIILDEPGNQEAGNQDLRLMLEKLGKLTSCQSIVFSSFHQSETTYEECTVGVDFKLFDIGTKKLIQKL